MELLYSRAALIELAKKCSRYTNFGSLNLFPRRVLSKAGGALDVDWCIFLTMRCLSKIINSSRFLQLYKNN
jgi:hypothetical protein